jgi:hypothetical protein
MVAKGTPTVSFVGTTSAYTTNLANNYNLVWKAGGDTTLNTTNNTTNNTTPWRGTQNFKVADSTETINPVTLTVTVAGERDYGTTMGHDNLYHFYYRPRHQL